MRSKIKIGNRILGDDRPIFIIVEAGVTCNYDLDIAKEMINVTADSGADAIKFIFWFPEEIMSDKSIIYQYNTINGPKSENMFEMLNGLRFTFEQWRELKNYGDKKDVVVLSTVNSPSGIVWAEELGLEAYKLSSWDFNYHSLWRKIARLGKPMIIDTGPVTSVELGKVMEIMKQEGNDQSLLVHCFHTDIPTEKNMRSIPYMRNAFRSLIGYSAPSQDYTMDLLAVALGAVYLEKRMTISRKLPGHHHILSMEPDEFKKYVETIRAAQDALGKEDLIPSPGDLRARKGAFRHLVANQFIAENTVLTEDMLEAKRPEEGISPEHMFFFIGRRTKRDLEYNEPLTWDVV